MTIDELVDNFSLFDDWEDRYKYVIDLAATVPPMDDALKTPFTKVQGCMSQVWMVPSWDDAGRLTLAADSDAQIVKGLIAVLLVIFNGKTRAEIAATDVDAAFRRLGLDGHLSDNRRNGFFSMVERVRALASQ
jgi:cysteine desulfuration protein SufE